MLPCTSGFYNCATPRGLNTTYSYRYRTKAKQSIVDDISHSQMRCYWYSFLYFNLQILPGQHLSQCNVVYSLCKICSQHLVQLCNTQLQYIVWSLWKTWY